MYLQHFNYKVLDRQHVGKTQTHKPIWLDAVYAPNITFYYIELLIQSQF